MKRFLTISALLCAVVLMSTTPGATITYGQRDNGDHHSAGQSSSDNRHTHCGAWLQPLARVLRLHPNL